MTLLTRLDPIRWPSRLAWVVLAASALAVVVSVAFLDRPWLFRLAFFTGYTAGVVVLLRGSGVRFREVAILLVPAVAAFVFFRYFTDGWVHVVGQTVAFSIPLFVGMGIGRNFVLGTLAPGYYPGFAPADDRAESSLRHAWREMARATTANDYGVFTAHLERAVILGNIRTTDPEWIEVRARFLAAAFYTGDWAGQFQDGTEAERKFDVFRDAFQELVDRRRTWFGRWGRPTTPAPVRQLPRASR